MTLTIADYLAHLRQSVEDIETASRGLDRFGFEANRVAQLAIVKAIENIGEAARNLTRHHTAYATESEYTVSWRRWIAVRNRLAHGYFAVDLTIVWNLVVGNIPDLKLALDRLTAEQDDESRHSLRR